TYGTSATVTKDFEGNKVFSNSYDGSYIRNYILNGRDTYTTGWGSGSGNSKPTSVTKFSQLSSGVLKDYVVTPSNVNWQKNSSRQKNDPGFTAVANYPCNWINDKIWLPSMYEVYDNTLTANSNKTSYTENGGLWYTGNGNAASDRARRSGLTDCWVRTASYGNASNAHFINASGGTSTTFVGSTKGVRPAIHINLSVVAEEADYICDHEWGEWTGVSATCTTAAEQIRTCPKCGKEETQTIDALGHDMTQVKASTANCTLTGLRAHYKCLRCNCLFWDSECNNACTEEEVTEKALGHDFVDTVTAPKCETGGSTKHTCARDGCGYEFTDSYTDPLGHSWNDGEITKPPTCTAEGEKTFTCLACGKTRTEAVEKVAHTPGDAATCTAAQTCTVCGVQLNAPLGHNYEAVEGGVAPTCTEPGSGKVRCSRCGDEQVGASIPATGHNPGDAATCTTPQICTVCETELAPALGHDFGEWVTTKEATFVEDGEKRRDCSRCDEYQTEVIPAKGVSTNELTLDLATNFEYGDEITPVISANYGEVVLKWVDATTGG
ncbi:MAG: hypothetical protein K2O67_00195, partial [Clostridia bacterium]|nr:hypothetical protein [Clostridia bacterium]